ncbi:MAG: hypothetical protein WC441_03095 [Patescibacteria group bacterium]
MKKILPLLIKIVLAGLFLYNLHFFYFVTQSFHQAGQKAPPPCKADGGREDIRFLNEKIQKAKALGSNYLAEEYFSDLTAIRLKEKNNDFDRSAVLAVNNTLTELMGTFTRNLSNLRGHSSDQAYRDALFELEDARSRSQETLEPGSSRREQELQAQMDKPGYWHAKLVSLLSWLSNFYLKNFFLALSLLWLWWYQEKNSLRIKNPFSFLICLLLYPLTIGRVWYKLSRDNFRALALQVEFRRRQTDIFALISEDELADIRRFANSRLKLRDYRHYLDQRGLYRHQSLMPALAVTLLFLIVTPITKAQTKVDANLDGHIQTEIKINAPPGDQGAQIDYSQTPTASPALVFDDYRPIILALASRLLVANCQEKFPGFLKNPDPIPLFD